MDKNSNLGTSVGLLICGIILLVFPKWTGVGGVGEWLFFVFGLLLLLLGALGTSIELFKR